MASPSGNAVEFIDGEYAVFAGTQRSNASDWEVRSTPNIDFENKSGQGSAQIRSMVGRFLVHRDILGEDLIAIHLIGVRGNISVSMNGTELFRNFADVTDQKNSWYRPFLIPVPEAVLTTGANELEIQSFTVKTAGIGRVFIGSNSALQAKQYSRHFWHISAPRAANFAMLAMGLLVFLFWIARKNEIELLWLSISVVLFFVRNHQYYTEEIPFHYKLYSDITVCANYFSLVSLAAFYFCYIKFPHRNKIIMLMFLVGLPIVVRHIFTNSSLVLYLTSAIVLSLVAVVAFRDMLQNRTIERGVLGLGVSVLPIASLHDLTMLILHKGNGHAMYFAVFCGAIYTIAFVASFGRRSLNAISALERSQLVLEKRVADTRSELMDSEAKRRELILAQAMTNERARLMQEMHDGIGSNLTTALAVARQQKQPNETISVLSRALGDLKLTVDSLEPVEGDVMVLLGNLRHRMARDLDKAGITCKWEVKDCRPIEWLDATNALHVLRIHNEAISNILAHSSAKIIRVGCYEKTENNCPGIQTYIKDDGDGFDVQLATKGKGMANMRARAKSLHGVLSCKSEPGHGTDVRLWLPYVRQTN
ncbi:MAG: ATP-binding protein [Paracoccaceae bacterium]